MDLNNQKMKIHLGVSKSPANISLELLLPKAVDELSS